MLRPCTRPMHVHALVSNRHCMHASLVYAARRARVVFVCVHAHMCVFGTEAVCRAVYPRVRVEREAQVGGVCAAAGASSCDAYGGVQVRGRRSVCRACTA